MLLNYSHDSGAFDKRVRQLDISMMAFNECISHECRALISAANGGGFQNEISVLFLSLFIGFLSGALLFPPSLSSSPLRVHIPFHHAFPTRTLLLTPATRRHVSLPLHPSGPRHTNSHKGPRFLRSIASGPPGKHILNFLESTPKPSVVQPNAWNYHKGRSGRACRRLFFKNSRSRRRLLLRPVSS